MSARGRPVVIAQMSDLHVAASGANEFGIDAAAGVARCLAHLAALELAPDLLVLSGDLADEGSAAEYARLRAMLEPVRVPVCLMPGNHDRRGALRAAFAGHGYLGSAGRMHYHRDVRGLRVIALDSVIEGEEGGQLDEAQLAWLEGLLRDEPGMPALVLLHHPPVPTGFSRMDKVSVEAAGAARLGAIIAAAPQVRAVLCGHVHRSVQAAWQGVQVSVCPSAGYQAKLRLGAGRFEGSPLEPPAYLLHHWDGSQLATHVLTT